MFFEIRQSRATSAFHKRTVVIKPAYVGERLRLLIEAFLNSATQKMLIYYILTQWSCFVCSICTCPVKCTLDRGILFCRLYVIVYICIRSVVLFKKSCSLRLIPSPNRHSELNGKQEGKETGKIKVVQSFLFLGIIVIIALRSGIFEHI